MIIISTIMASSVLSPTKYKQTNDHTTLNNFEQNRGRSVHINFISLKNNKKKHAQPHLFRSTRAASLAIPTNTYADLLNNTEPVVKHFNLAPPSASTINIRRHSSHHCPIIDKVSDEQKSLQAKPVLPQVPPPVPKRNFQKYTENMPNNKSPGKSPDTAAKMTAVDTNQSIKRRNSKRISRRSKTRNKISNADSLYNCSADQSSDEDLLSLESSVFEEGPVSSETPVFPSTNNFISSNRSSSDSNKSQSTIDTGYMSNDNDRIFFGGNSDSYRSRFSSVDTQSSIDSSSDTQKCLNSPQPAIVHPQFSRSLNKYYSAAVGADVKLCKPPDSKRPPVVPMRKQTSVPKIPSPIGTATASPPAVPINRARGIPPTPPIRSQVSLDSGKIFHSNQMLGGIFPAQQSAGSNASARSPNFVATKNCDNLQEMYTKPAMGTIKNGANGKQQFSQIHHTKLTQRQDSSLSSDSCSMTSSPGYNTKSMEAPLLQYASKINKTSNGHGIRHQDSIDSFGMTSKYNFSGRYNLRQDSNVSSDSFSQTSSPGYNTKLFEAPLLAHSVKLHASN